MAGAAASPRVRYRQRLLGVRTHEGAPGATDDGEAPQSLDALWSRLEDARGHDVGPSDERAWLAYAPTALVAGCWLAGSVRVHATHSPLGAALLDAHYRIAGRGESARHDANRYRAWLGERGLHLPPLGSERFAADTRLCDADFALALVGLDLGCAGRACLPAVLGFHAAMTLAGPPAAVGLARELLRAEERDEREALARRCLVEYAREQTGDWPRVWRGAKWWLEARQIWEASFRPREEDPWEAMEAIVRARTRAAHGQHGRVHLDGCPLDDWLDPQACAPRELLRRLARSSWVVPGRPEESRLCTTSIQFGGPMFGVFSDDDAAVMRRWVAALPAEPPELTPPAASRTHEPAVVAHPPGARASLAERYHQLLHPELYDLRAWASGHLDALLRRARRRGVRGWPAEPGGLAAWVDAEIGAQVAGIGARPEQIAERVSRRDAVWLLTQLAPAALVDGAWLQGTTEPAYGGAVAAGLLLQIYRDEHGAGVPAQHHGNVMRATLASAGVELPACDSVAFARHEAFLPEAFAMPVLWLATASQGARRMPELLGLNLAIEMAGIGRGYRTAAAIMRRHGLSPLFFDLHNSIDNPSTGHTAWSVEAVARYLEQAAAEAGEAVVPTLWRRLGDGFSTYAEASAPLSRAVTLRVGPRVAWRWLLGRARRAAAVD